MVCSLLSLGWRTWPNTSVILCNKRKQNRTVVCVRDFIGEKVQFYQCYLPKSTKGPCIMSMSSKSVLVSTHKVLSSFLCHFTSRPHGCKNLLDSYVNWSFTREHVSPKDLSTRVVFDGSLFHRFPMRTYLTRVPVDGDKNLKSFSLPLYKLSPSSRFY